ncbi:MAG: AI-2E family transporter [Geminicoccaceae bacterium]|nr:MAG: AI-2E family transporter [Geminicoccaceae bacterium]
MDEPVQAAAASRHTVDLSIRLVVLALVIFWCGAIVWPFVEILLWALILAVAVHQPFAWLSARLGERPVLAAVLLTLAMLGLLLGPVSLLATQLVANLQLVIPALLQGQLRVPPPPEWLAALPIVGEQIAAFWTLASTNLRAAVQQLAPRLEPVGTTALLLAADAALAFFKMLAATALTGFLLVMAAPMTRQARSFARRLVPGRGDDFISLIGATTRGVARGVVGVAMLQSLLAGIGFLVAGIPGAGILTFLVLVLGILQIGAPLVLIGAVAYAWWALDPLTALLLTIWTIPVGLFDNVLRPILMARGVRVPMLVILIGVVGGVLLHGLIGLFIGPVVLAIGYELLIAWIAGEPGVPADDGSGHHAPIMPSGDTP